MRFWVLLLLAQGDFRNDSPAPAPPAWRYAAWCAWTRVLMLRPGRVLLRGAARRRRPLNTHPHPPPAAAWLCAHVEARVPQGTAARSQSRPQQTAAAALRTACLDLEPGTLAAALSAAAHTPELSAAAAKAVEPARRLLLQWPRTQGASAVDAYAEPVWREVVQPGSFDARALGLFSPPRDQGQCATCVAFAIATAAEAAISAVQPGLGRAILKQGGLSAQQLYFCNSKGARSCKSVSGRQLACKVQLGAEACTPSPARDGLSAHLRGTPAGDARL
jgi:hypothetical protein